MNEPRRLNHLAGQVYSWFNPPHRPVPCAACVNRSSSGIANSFISSFHSFAARLESAVMLRSASQVALLAASSLGKCPRVLMILRSRLCTLSMALVV